MSRSQEIVAEKLLGRKWIDFDPKRPEEYCKAREAFTALFQGIDGVRGLYEFGKVKNPGISDIDVAIVLDTKTQQGGQINEALGKIYSSPFYKDMLCGGTVMVFSDRDFPLVGWLDDIEIQCMYGDAQTLQELDAHEQTLLSIFQIFDWLPERLLSFSKVLSNDSILTKSALGYLYSIRYTFQLLAKFGISEEIPLNDFSRTIEHVRDNWAELTSREQINSMVSLILDAYVLGEKCMEDFSHWFQRKFNVTLDNSALPRQFNLTDRTGFVLKGEKTSPSQYLESSLSRAHFYLPVPEVWMYHWSCYACVRGFISDRIRNNLKGVIPKELAVPLGYGEISRLRIELCNNMATFLSDTCIQRGLYKFGWFYK